MNAMKKMRELRFFIGNPIVSLTTGKLIFEDDKVQTHFLALISVPGSMDLTETFDVFGEYTKYIKTSRVLKTELSRHYTLIVYFERVDQCDEFYHMYNNRKYSMLDDDVIVLKKVSSISIEREGAPCPLDEINEGIEKKEETHHDAMHLFTLEDASEEQRNEEEMIETKGHNQDMKFKDCPICLETFNREDTTTILLCSHRFHVKCLQEWTDQTCPVCRYHQHPFELSFCERCDVHIDLWCCLLCGFIGCGGEVPVSGHIRDHATETNHVYSKPIIKDVTRRKKGIWDHSKEDYIHSLIYNRQRDSLVAVEDNRDEGKKGADGKKASEESDLIHQLISTQLDSQRCFFEQELKNIEKDFDELHQDNQYLCEYLGIELREVEEESMIIAKSLEEAKKVDADLHNTLDSLQEQISNMVKLNSKLKKKKKKLEEELEKKRDEKRKELLAIKKQISDIIVEIKDIKMHNENKKKLESLPIRGGSMMILETGNSGKRQKK